MTRNAVLPFLAGVLLSSLVAWTVATPRSSYRLIPSYEAGAQIQSRIEGLLPSERVKYPDDLTAMVALRGRAVTDYVKELRSAGLVPLCTVECRDGSFLLCEEGRHGVSVDLLDLHEMSSAATASARKTKDDAVKGERPVRGDTFLRREAFSELLGDELNKRGAGGWRAVGFVRDLGIDPNLGSLVLVK